MNLQQVTTELGQHPRELAGGAAGLVVLYALYRRNKTAAAATTSANTVAATGTNPGATGTTAVAGLSGTPNTQTSDIENWVNDQLNAFAANQPGAAPATAPVPSAADPGVQYGQNNTNQFVYDDRTATYGQVQNNGGVDWLTGLQATILGASQKNAAAVSDAGRVNAQYQPTASVLYSSPSPSPVPTAGPAKYGPGMSPAVPT